MRTWVAQMRKGLVEFCVLAAVKDREAYGYEILQRLGRADALAISESAVYPILARLTAEGQYLVGGFGLGHVAENLPSISVRPGYHVDAAGVRSHWLEGEPYVGRLAARPPKGDWPHHAAGGHN